MCLLDYFGGTYSAGEIVSDIHTQEPEQGPFPHSPNWGLVGGDLQYFSRSLLWVLWVFLRSSEWCCSMNTTFLEFIPLGCLISSWEVQPQSCCLWIWRWCRWDGLGCSRECRRLREGGSAHSSVTSLPRMTVLKAKLRPQTAPLVFKVCQCSVESILCRPIRSVGKLVWLGWMEAPFDVSHDHGLPGPEDMRFNEPNHQISSQIRQRYRFIWM